jgi:hypothetical protein
MSRTWLVPRGTTTGRREDGLGPDRPSRRCAFFLWGGALAGLALIGLIGSPSVLAANAVPAGKDPPFTISGSVDGLAPGVGSQLPLTVSNPYDFPIKVTTLTVGAGDAGGPCLGKSLEVQPLGGTVQVPARGSATTLLAVTLLKSSPEICQQATWPLTYGGQAVRVSSAAGGGGTGTGPSGSEGSGTGTSGGSAGGTPIGSPGQTGNGPSSTGLAFTGLTLWILIAAAAALLISGAAILLAQQRRRRRLAAEHLEGSWAP